MYTEKEQQLDLEVRMRAKAELRGKKCSKLRFWLLTKVIKWQLKRN